MAEFAGDRARCVMHLSHRHYAGWLKRLEGLGFPGEAEGLVRGALYVGSPERPPDVPYYPDWALVYSATIWDYYVLTSSDQEVRGPMSGEEVRMYLPGYREERALRG